MDTDARWAPVRRGLTYCSPGCGMGCTVVQHDRAELQGNELAAALGAGWEPRVWENMGWHYAARIPGEVRLEVHPAGIRPGGAKTYTAFVHNLFVGRGDAPQTAFEAALNMARAERDRLAVAVGAAEEGTTWK